MICAFMHLLTHEMDCTHLLEWESKYKERIGQDERDQADMDKPPYLEMETNISCSSLKVRSKHMQRVGVELCRYLKYAS